MRTSFSTLLLSLFIIFSISAQKKVKSFSFKKGEVLDIILLTSAPNSTEGFNYYKKTAFPVAFKYGYKPQPGFKITKLTLGNHLPSSLIIGKWNSKNNREGFLNTIVSKVPDFHIQRRNIFSYFGLSYHELNTDLQFSVNTKKYNVATAFWKKNTKQYSSFLNNWKKSIQKAGGKFILQLPKGISPTGYNYNPDLFSIIEWETKEDFDRFSKKHPLNTYETLKNVHQFVIQ